MMVFASHSVFVNGKDRPEDIALDKLGRMSLFGQANRIKDESNVITVLAWWIAFIIRKIELGQNKRGNQNNLTFGYTLAIIER
ncbi:MAG: hypothetical protein ACKEQK_00495 [Candidatus Hodgkinia cicadicola]